MKRILGVGGALILVALGSGFYQTLDVGKHMPLSAAVIKTGEDTLYPNETLTPGDILNRDKSIVCQPTYYRSIKDIPETVKKAVHKKYGIRYPQEKDKYEIDRYIPIELGGSNDMKNLWIQAGDPRPGYREKNAVENYLHAQVCTSHMTLTEAQELIASDWYSIYLSISR